MTLRHRLPAVVFLACALALALAALPPSHARAAASPYLGLVSMGMPTAPQPYMPSDFALTKHFRQTSRSAIDNGYGPPADAGNQPMTADHGADCGAPPATHQQGDGYADMMFVCHDHVMTAINSGAYGELLFQPNKLVDFTAGPATVTISVSTFRASARDWIDWQFVPFGEQLAVNTDNNVPENIKLPQDAVRLGQTPGACFCLPLAQEVAGGATHDLGADWWTDVNALLPASKTVRTPVTITISRTHVTETMAGHIFLDKDFPVPLPFTQAVFQVMHHSYNPTKDNSGVPATWHWSNLGISSAVPYYLDMAMPDAAGDYSWLPRRVSFAAAPSGSSLRFQWFDSPPSAKPSGSISFDGGATWQPLAAQHLAPLTGLVSDAQVVSIWQPVPQGATSALLRGSAGWYARDFYVMAAGGVSSAPPATPTPMPTAMPSPTAVPPTATPTATATAAPTPVAINALPCTVTFNGVAKTGTCTGTFTPSH